MNKVSAINLETGEMLTTQISGDAVAKAIRHKHHEWSKYRLEKEDIWLQGWASYIGSPVAMKYLRNEVGHIVGQVNDDWRHRINTGKAYEIVETAIAYLTQAFFPNRDYFLVKPELPGYREEARLTTAWMKEKLRQANLPTYWEMFLRQLLITGFSVIALPWVTKKEKMRKRVPNKMVLDEQVGEEVTVWDVQEYEKLTYNNAKLEVLDAFDVLVDPNCSDLKNASMFRNLKKTVADVVKGYHGGVYSELEINTFLKKAKAPKQGVADGQVQHYKHATASFMGLNYDPEQRVECYEYWGSLEVDGYWLESIVCTVINGQVARLQDVPYWAGKPFVAAVAVPVPNHVYGLGILEPVRGMIHENNILTNCRLDNLSIAINDTWLMVDDGVTNPDEVYRAPGHIITMGAEGNIRPMGTSSDFTISYGEQEFLNSRLDAATGIGAYVSATPGRNAERVTAEEVAAVREAGGTRLSSVHRHIERTAFLPFLEKFLYLAKQFVVDDDVVQQPGTTPGETNYFAVGAEELNKEYKLHVVGADFLAERDKQLADINAFIETVIQVPEWQAMLNWEVLLEEYVRKFHLSEDFEQLIIRGIQQKQQAQQEEAAPASPEEEMMGVIGAAQGQPGLMAHQGKAAAMGNNAAMAETAAMMSMASPENVAASTQLGAMADMPMQ